MRRQVVAGHVLLAVAGVLDATAARPLAESVSWHLREVPDGGELLVDLAGCTWCDVAGLGALIAASRRAARVGVPVRVMNCPPELDEMLGHGARNLFASA